MNTKEKQQFYCLEEYSSGILCGNNTLIDLAKSWKRKGDDIVCSDLYFASFESSLEINQLIFRFIGVVNMEHRHFPVETL